MYKRLISLVILCFSVLSMQAQDLNLIPQPNELVRSDGEFILNSTTQIELVGKDAESVAKFFWEKLRTSTGWEPRVRKGSKKESKGVRENTIRFEIDPTIEGAEAYRLEVTPQRVRIAASTSDGLFWGLQTLLQLCPADVENPKTQKMKQDWHLPALTINDAPRFAYRGIHIDPCRHFLPAAEVKKLIDMLATYKINRIHFHLTEDQGWRIEIKKYPKLTEVGARRVEGDGSIHEGFYTQSEIRDIVKYAAERHIDVIPELEIPGHELAAIAAYPELSCRGDSITPRIIWGVEDIVMCPGKELMFTFLQDVIDEMVALFPSKYFHIGGDESPRTEWQKCDSCQARMRHLGYTREAQLQDYVIERIGAYLKGKGKQIIGWDEILEGGNLEPSAIVMSWRGEQGGIEAAKKDHQVIMTPAGKGLYFDFYQGDPITEPTAIGGYSPLEKVYNYDPVPDALKSAGKEDYVLGVQANNWSEYIPGPATLELRMFPRALALAEIAWTKPELKDFRDFCRRVDGDGTVRLKKHYITPHFPQPDVAGVSSNKLAFTDSRTIELSTTRPLTILYTTDNSQPSLESARYMAPLTFTQNTTLRTRVLTPSGEMGPTRTIRIDKQKYARAANAGKTEQGLATKIYDGTYTAPSQLMHKEPTREIVITDLGELRTQTAVPADVRNVRNYVAVAEGYLRIPADGVYEFSSCNNQVFIDGRLQIDNSHVVAPRDTRENVELALAKGLHKFKVVFIGGIFGGWPTYWSDGSVKIRPVGGSWHKIAGDMLAH